MSLKITDPKKSTNKITYNFYSLSLNSNTDSITKNLILEDNHIKITNYPYNGNAFHIQHDIFGTSKSFIINEIRIVKGLYNNANLELIIEAFSNTNEVTYVCIPLKTDKSTQANNLDMALTSLYTSSDSCPSKLNLNSLIPNQSILYYLIYKEKQSLFTSNKSFSNVCIVIFKDAIPITLNTYNTVNSNLKTLSLNLLSSGKGDGTNTYKYIERSNIIYPENLSDSNIYIDCKGNDEDDLLTSALQNKYKLDEKSIKSIMSYIFVLLMFVFLFYVLDKIYRNSFSEGDVNENLKSFFKVLHNILCPENKIEFLNITYITLGIIIVFIICFSLFISAFVVKTNRVPILLSAIFMTSFLIFFCFILFLKSVQNPERPNG